MHSVIQVFGFARTATFDFSVTYTDNVAVNVPTLDSADLRISGPGGFDQLATFVSVDDGKFDITLQTFDRTAAAWIMKTTLTARPVNLNVRRCEGEAMRCVARFSAIIAGLALCWPCDLSASDLANLNDIPSDLTVPAVTTGEPRAGARVWQSNPGYEDWKIAHALYLPADWKPDGRYPVIFEYPGNGNFKNAFGDRSDGRVEDCQLGFGLTGGKGMIWVSLPFVDPKTRSHATVWWGDPDETASYCKQTVARICKEYGGDPKRLILTGFSRGAIACNYIGLRDDEIAKLWRAFMPHSHYDGVRAWNYTDSDAESARKRLERLGDRPQFISHEGSTEAVESYLKRASPEGVFTFVPIPYPNHSSAWVLKDLPVRTKAREWLADVLLE